MLRSGEYVLHCGREQGQRGSAGYVAEEPTDLATLRPVMVHLRPVGDATLFPMRHLVCPEAADPAGNRTPRDVVDSQAGVEEAQVAACSQFGSAINAPLMVLAIEVVQGFADPQRMHSKLFDWQIQRRF